MDYVGFAFDNYDATGAFITTGGKRATDSRSTRAG